MNRNKTTYYRKNSILWNKLLHETIYIVHKELIDYFSKLTKNQPPLAK